MFLNFWHGANLYQKSCVRTEDLSLNESNLLHLELSLHIVILGVEQHQSA